MKISLLHVLVFICTGLVNIYEEGSTISIIGKLVVPPTLNLDRFVNLEIHLITFSFSSYLNICGLYV